MGKVPLQDVGSGGFGTSPWGSVIHRRWKAWSELGGGQIREDESNNGTSDPYYNFTASDSGVTPSFWFRADKAITFTGASAVTTSSHGMPVSGVRDIVTSSLIWANGTVAAASCVSGVYVSAIGASTVTTRPGISFTGSGILVPTYFSATVPSTVSALADIDVYIVFTTSTPVATSTLVLLDSSGIRLLLDTSGSTVVPGVGNALLNPSGTSASGFTALPLDGTSRTKVLRYKGSYSPSAFTGTVEYQFASATGYLNTSANTNPLIGSVLIGGVIAHSLNLAFHGIIHEVVIFPQILNDIQAAGLQRGLRNYYQFRGLA